MKIKFNITTGEIIEASNSPTHILVPEEGFAIESYSGEIAPAQGMMRMGPDLIRFKTSEEIPVETPTLEDLIIQKTRDLAIESLKSEGMIDQDQKITELGIQTATSARVIKNAIPS